MKKYILGLVSALLLFGCTTQGIEKVDVSKKSSVADINKKDYYDELALHDAIRANYFDIAKILIVKGAKVDEKDRYGYTPLHLASIFNAENIAKLLIEKGVDVNSIDKYNDTPLIDSTRNNFTKISQLLVCNGANRNVADKNGITALHYAIKNKNLYVAELLITPDLKPFCQESLEISLDEVINSSDTTPTICGKVSKGLASTVNITIPNPLDETTPFGSYLAIIDSQNNTWCSEVTNELPLGEYKINALGEDQSFNKSQINSTLNIVEQVAVVEEPVIPVSEVALEETQSTNSMALAKTLHQALEEEFSNDFKIWNATLNNDLTIRFKDPSLMFKRGNSDLSDAYKEVLHSFMPRYIKIIEEYKDKISMVNIEGHTSSTYRSAKTDEQKFKKNEILSAKRANNVFEYIKSLDNEMISKNLTWIEENFKTIGKSSSELIKNFDGSENKELSKRVEFRIVLNSL